MEGERKDMHPETKPKVGATGDGDHWWPLVMVMLRLAVQLAWNGACYDDWNVYELFSSKTY